MTRRLLDLFCAVRGHAWPTVDRSTGRVWCPRCTKVWREARSA